MITGEERARKLLEKAKKDGFDNFMRSPAVKMIISILPPSEHTEQALRAAFEQGIDYGSAVTTIEILKSALDRRS